MQELLEVKTQEDTKYFFAEPMSHRLKEPGVRIFDEDGNFFEEFESWNEMIAQFEQRGWEVTDYTIWSLEGTYVGHLLANR